MMFKPTQIARRGLLLTALAALALPACEETTTGPGPKPVYTDFAFVTTTDFATGSASVIALDTTLTTYKDVEPIHSDAISRFFAGRIYVVNRFGADNIQVLEPTQGFQTIKQFSVGNGSDPHDIAFSSRTRAFVPRYNETEIWIVDPGQGRRSGLIDVGWLADGDGIPEMDHMVRVGNRIFVSVQRLDRSTDWGPVGQSYIAVFDPATEQFIDADPVALGTQALLLAGTNPYSELVVNGYSLKIWVSCVGRFGVFDGGLEVVDPVTLTTSGIVLTEATVSGDITDVVPIDANRGAAIVTDSNFNNLLLGFDLSTPGTIDTIYAPGSFSLQDAELSPGVQLFLTDRTPSAPGIRVFRTDTWSQVTTSPIDVGLPPFDIEFGFADY